MGQDGEGRKRGLEYWLDKGVLGLLFAGWYATNIAFNIYNKQALVACPYPTSMTVLQFGIGSLLSCALWATGVAKLPKLTPGLVSLANLQHGFHIASCTLHHARDLLCFVNPVRLVHFTRCILAKARHCRASVRSLRSMAPIGQG